MSNDAPESMDARQLGALAARLIEDTPEDARALALHRWAQAPAAMFDETRHPWSGSMPAELAAREQRDWWVGYHTERGSAGSRITLRLTDEDFATRDWLRARGQTDASIYRAGLAALLDERLRE